MGRSQRFAILLALVAFAFTSAWSSQAPPTPTATFSFLNPLQISNNGSTLEIQAGTGTDYNIDISGLRVNLSCAQRASFSSIDNIRVALLEQGCAKIIGAPANSSEQEAQAQAKANRVGFWAPNAPPEAHHKNSSWLGSFFLWVKTHKLISIPSIGLVVSIAASPWLLKFIGWVVQIFYKRRVSIVITGAPSAGKSGLWTAWSNEYIPGAAGQISQLSPSSIVERAQIAPVRMGKWALHPTLIDTPGGSPEEVLKGIRRARWLKGAIERYRTRRILLFVVAPHPLEAVAGGDPCDASYIDKQAGYAYLPAAIIGQRDPKIRPDMVIMFVTKFDLLSSTPPRDSDGTAVSKMVNAFQEHQRLVKSACDDANVPYTWIIGSSTKFWSIDQLRGSLAKVIE